MKLRVGDTVLVRSGRDRGKTGKILKVLPGSAQVIVEGINQVKRSRKPTQKQPRGGISTETAPLHVAKVGIVHPTNAKRASRIGYRPGADGKQKVRVYRQAEGKEIKP